MKSFIELKKNLKKDFSGLPETRVALLGDSSTQLLVQALKGCGYDNGFNLEIFESDFNQVQQQVFDSQSLLYEFNPSVIILFYSTHQLLNKYNKLPPEEYCNLAATELALVDDLFNTLSSRSQAKVIYYNYTEINDSVFGNYASKTEFSFLFQLRKLNYLLMEFALEHPAFYICDLSAIQNNVGRQVFFRSSIYVNTEMVLSMEVLPEVASKTVDIIAGISGKIKKCLVLDLDNTLWGGVVGDDGIENIQLGSLGIGKAFTEFQYWLKKLKNRGIILAVCSKNTEHIAKEPFEKHPDMVLRLDDIAIFVANWENKVDNIRHIQKTLNIGFDSMVFIDDNPFERNMVRENIPGIVIPELPEDPADYLEHLYSLNLFETISFSKEDSERTQLYKVEEKRVSVSKSYLNEDDFLKSLQMISVVEPFNKYNTPRVAQLSQRSNQFNLRTVRYTEGDIERIAKDNNHFTFSFTLTDKFGDNGLICVVVLKKEDHSTLFIENWFMSCRVLKRGMENFVLNTIANFARENKFELITGEYIPSPKNDMVKEHYLNLGFEKNGKYWSLGTNSYKMRTCYIEAK